MNPWILSKVLSALSIVVKPSFCRHKTKFKPRFSHKFLSFCRHIWKKCAQMNCLLLSKLKLVEYIVRTLHKAFKLPFASSRFFLCLFKRRIFFPLYLLSKQAHSLEWKKHLKTHQLFLLSFFTLLFVLLGPHQLLVRPSLLFSVPHTFSKLLFICRLGWFGPATFPWGGCVPSTWGCSFTSSIQLNN